MMTVGSWRDLGSSVGERSVFYFPVSLFRRCTVFVFLQCKRENERKFIMKTTISVAPVLKWAGGKRQLLRVLQPLFPANIKFFCEPFLGGAAVFFYLMPGKAWINDVNKDLMSFYKCIKDHVDELIAITSTFKNNEEDFYRIRSWDRNPDEYNKLPEIQKAARLLYLNKTCYNGLYRVNKAGEFNAPYGHYKNPEIIDEQALRTVCRYFNQAEVTMTSLDYAQVLDAIPADSFVYLDPPYAPLTATSNFTNYAKEGFTIEDQIRLKEQCDKLTERNIKFMLSNSATDFLRELYSDYEIVTVHAKRAINSNASKRGLIEEIVVRNYK